MRSITIPKSLLQNPEVSPFNKLLLAVIKHYNNKGVTNIPISTLATDLNVKERAIFYSLQALYNTGYLKVFPDKKVFYKDYVSIHTKNFYKKSLSNTSKL